ncbi:hypothetical protein [uncultured Nocardioides sp.]|uniref:hypothetical protein n=1 Tax=uncultured Nocardioides sp. TaxID=198441 RepID=UPI0025D3846A|nr:hypothetical protein [uncultured Nocardioides sp.]
MTRSSGQRSATFLDGEGTENLVVPAQLVAMAAFGALVGRLLPALAGPDRRGPVVGALVGVAMGLVGIGVFFWLISGADGA